MPDEIVVHCIFAEFRGRTPEEVLRAMYVRAGHDPAVTSFADWCEYNRNLARHVYRDRLPPCTDMAGMWAMLNNLVERDALRLGPMPPPASLDHKEWRP